MHIFKVLFLMFKMNCALWFCIALSPFHYVAVLILFLHHHYTMLLLPSPTIILSYYFPLLLATTLYCYFPLPSHHHFLYPSCDYVLLLLSPPSLPVITLLLLSPPSPPGTASVARGWSAYFDSLIDKKISKFFMETMPIGVDQLSEYPDFFAFGITILLTSELILLSPAPYQSI